MAQYTCNANMAADLLPMLVKSRAPFALEWMRPDLAVFEVVDSVMQLIQTEAIHLNVRGRGLTIAPTDQWGCFDDMAFPLMSPADLREGFEPASNLNLWEDATHQITFDGGKHWTNVFIDECTPPHYVACSDGKRSWPCDSLHADRVIKRPIAPLTPDQEATVEEILVRNRVPYGTATGRISDPQPLIHCKCGAPAIYALSQECSDCHLKVVMNRMRVPASVGEQAFQSCGFLDTEFDSDPSVVGE